jgi:hypothetical protein
VIISIDFSKEFRALSSWPSELIYSVQKKKNKTDANPIPKLLMVARIAFKKLGIILKFILELISDAFSIFDESI